MSAVLDWALEANRIDTIAGVIYLSSPAKFKTSEKVYLSVRQQEELLYPDDVVRQLPTINSHHPLSDEWQIRKRSAKMLVDYLKDRAKLLTILETGCGNGWLANYLASQLDCRVYALDINEYELEQGARVFGNNSNLTFLYGDLFDEILPISSFDVILLVSSVQYFSDLTHLLNRLVNLLCEGGEIHIMDSPLYSRGQVNSAKDRTRNYYKNLGFPEMTANYYHHAFDSLRPFQVEYLYKPGGIIQRIRRKILANTLSPFPWVKLALNPN